jgi:fatty acid desaturase
LNRFWLKFWTSLALWSAPLWMMHHSVRHHAFTGNPDLDPDAQHAKPFIRKNLEAPRKKYVSSFGVKSRLAWAGITGLVFLLLPGMFLGQIASYWVLWPMKGHLWKMSYPNKKAMPYSWWQPFVTLAVFASFALNFDARVLLTYLLACNVAYACCILPDHDSFESVVENHVPVTEASPDWGEIQVRHSGNFKGYYFSKLCGGINFQIEHHLFPSVNHSYLEEISPIVQQTCKEFNIPYVSHSNLLTALWSVACAVKECMVEEDDDKTE